MRTPRTDITTRKLALDDHLLSTLIKLGIVETETDLSRQMGKNNSYFACMKSRGYSVHLGTLVYYAAKLSNELNGTSNVRERARLREALSAINETIQAKCMLREQELLAQ